MSEWINCNIEDGMILHTTDKSTKFGCGKNLSFWISNKMIKTFKGTEQLGLPKSWTVKIFEKDVQGKEKDKEVDEVSAQDAINMMVKFWKENLNKKPNPAETVEFSKEPISNISFEDDDIVF